MISFEQNILTIYGKKGQEWLNKLPSILANLINQNGLSQLKPVENMSFNYVEKGKNI
ncbi:hypothetical protein [Legionella sp. W05-934-2]|jgi:streptomycin 6-kinase|uniref:hypothetical protein n=1 Tax=Legionella sp. W05-934-2 TaxID=1198649 RepID=UPI00346261E0